VGLLNGKIASMRIRCEINEGEQAHIMADICLGCRQTGGRSAQIIRGTDGNIDACIVCPRAGEEDQPLRVMRSADTVNGVSETEIRRR
jgi:hypothetical protein